MPEGYVNKTIYEDLIKMMPSKIIIDVADEVRAIVAMVDGEALTVIAPLIRSLACQDVYDPLVRWAQQSCTPPVQIMAADNIDQFFLLDSLGEKIFTHLARHGMYIKGKLPYACEDVMTDGSLILSRIDKFEDYEHQARMQFRLPLKGGSPCNDRDAF